MEIKTCLPNIKDLSRGSRKERDYNHCWNKNEKTQEIPPEQSQKDSDGKDERKEKDIDVLGDENETR